MGQPEEVIASCSDRKVPVVCYPRPLDSVAFYLRRNDLRHYRSKETPELLQFLEKQPTTVVLFSHRHSLKQLREVLPPHLRLARTAPLGLCSMAVVCRHEPTFGVIEKTPRPGQPFAWGRREAFARLLTAPRHLLPPFEPLATAAP
jgi:hypothetical protein